MKKTTGEIFSNVLNLNSIRAIFYDCDGVLTDNHVLTDENGIESVFFNRSDGLAISRLRSFGIHQAIISTETNPVVARRAEKLRIPVIHGLDGLDGTPQRDKGAVLAQYCESNGIDPKQSIFIGNDINDLPALSIVGIPCAPADAEEEVIELVKSRGGWISSVNGGYGVVRELYRVLTRSFGGETVL